MKSVLPIVATAATAIAASYITRNGLKSESYKNLSLSPKQPPSRIFALAWAIIYIGYAVVWYKYVTTTFGHVLFSINMVLNLLWVQIFFGAGDVMSEGRITLSKLVITTLLLLTLFQAYYMWTTVEEHAALPTYILLIYSSWLLCAAGLNYGTTV
jgi:tryptophan-rich sensory protein